MRGGTSCWRRGLYCVLCLCVLSVCMSSSLTPSSDSGSVGHKLLGKFGWGTDLKSILQKTIADQRLQLDFLTAIPVPVRVVSGGLACVGLSNALKRWANRQRRTVWGDSRLVVARAYDEWTNERVLEHYWGEHIHLGYYYSNDTSRGVFDAFVQAKVDFVDEMLKFSRHSNSSLSARILDAGCGIGGSTRQLSRRLGPQAEVHGITLSSAQAERAQELSTGLLNVQYDIMDATRTSFPNNTFDLVWACESTEHMPDRKAFLEEMIRVLKPGGRIVIASWCQRDDSSRAFSAKETKTLQFLTSTWHHPSFSSIESLQNMLESHPQLCDVRVQDWTAQTLPSWWQSLAVGVLRPQAVLCRPQLWKKCFRDAITIWRMHCAFKAGLMRYGMFAAVKLAPAAEEHKQMLSAVEAAFPKKPYAD